MLDSALGDLNKDGLRDAAVVLQHSRSVSIKSADDTILAQPRILLILFRNPSGKSFSVKEQSNTLLSDDSWEKPEGRDPDYDDHREPYSSLGIGIDKGVLRIYYYFSCLMAMKLPALTRSATSGGSFL